jgi:hypothetical protein
MIVGAAGALALLLTVVITLLLHPPKGREPAGSTPSRTPTAAPIPVHPSPVAAPASALPPAVTPPAVVAAHRVPENPGRISPATPAAPAVTRPAPAVAPVAPPPVATAAVVAVAHPRDVLVPPAPAPAPAPVVEKPPTPPAIVWPEIVVKGFASVGGKPLVLLADGLTLETGTTAPNGVRLVEAGSGWFRLTYKGQARTYRQSGRSYTPCAEEPPASGTHP